MATDTESGELSPAKTRNPLETGPFVLRTLLEDAPLNPDGAQDDVTVNCVDYFGLQSSLHYNPLGRKTDTTRAQSICRYFSLGAPAFRPYSPRSSRSEWKPRLHPRLATTPCMPGGPLRVQCFPPRSPADPASACYRQSLYSVQLDRDLLLSTRTKPGVWFYTSQELQLDWGCRLERRRRQQRSVRRHRSAIAK